jgi:hypothetical protein
MEEIQKLSTHELYVLNENTFKLNIGVESYVTDPQFINTIFFHSRC